MTYQNLVVENDGGIITLTISREKAMNALNQQTMAELKSFFEHDFEHISPLKGVILTGAGPKAFVAGADISEFLGLAGGECIATFGFLRLQRVRLGGRAGAERLKDRNIKFCR